MESLSKILSTMIFIDLIENPNIPQKEIYTKQIKFDNIFNIFCKIKIPFALFTIFYFVLNPSINNIFIIGGIALFYFFINSYLESCIYSEIKKHFTIEKTILSLKKNVIKIIDNQNEYKKSTIEEAKSLLKIIDNTKEIEKIIKKTNYLSKERFYKYIKNKKGNSAAVDNLIKNKSIKEEYNLQKIRKEIQNIN